jgi:hypothetical protein
MVRAAESYPDASDEDVEQEQREGREQDGRAQRLLGFALVLAWIEHL